MIGFIIEIGFSNLLLSATLAVLACEVVVVHSLTGPHPSRLEDAQHVSWDPAAATGRGLRPRPITGRYGA